MKKTTEHQSLTPHWNKSLAGYNISPEAKEVIAKLRHDDHQLIENLNIQVFSLRRKIVKIKQCIENIEL